MNREVIIGMLLYLLSSLVLFILFFSLSLDWHSILFWLLFLFLSLSLGYIVSSYILSKKRKTEEHLLHLTKEILHELNIPLSTIQVNTTLLRGTTLLDEKGFKRLRRIDDAVVRLERLYRELVYSIKKEIHPIEKELFGLDELLEERVEIFHLLQRNPFVLNLYPLSIKVDKIGFEKCVDNLIDNAMKYSDKKYPIMISLIESELIIEDKGIGIDETELVSIFERYCQLNHKIYGEGIGLALVKSYCDSEGIGITINSQKGVGTKVILDLSKVIC